MVKEKLEIDVGISYALWLTVEDRSDDKLADVALLDFKSDIIKHILAHHFKLRNFNCIPLLLCEVAIVDKRLDSDRLT